MVVSVLLFGPAAELAGASSVRVDVAAEPNCAAVMRAIAEQSPALGRLASESRLAVNRRFAAPEQQVNEHDEIALIGLVSGG